MNKYGRTVAKLLHRIGLYDHLKQYDGKRTFTDMAKDKNLDKIIQGNYRYELVNYLLASGLISLGGKKEIIMSSDFKNISTFNGLNVYEEFDSQHGLFGDCFSGKRKGYTHDENPIVFDFIRKSRDPFMDPIACELVRLIKNYLGKKVLKEVLDAGCGAGDLTMLLSQYLGENVKVTGCDLSQKLIGEAQKCNLYKTGNRLTYSVEDLGKLPGTWTKKFGVVLLFDVFHDLTNPDKVMENAMKVLEDGGLIVVVDPRVSSDMLKNMNDQYAALALFFSLFYCLPTSCCSTAHGVGLGYERKEELLKKYGLEIVGQESILGIPVNHAYFLKKAKK